MIHKSVIASTNSNVVNIDIAFQPISEKSQSQRTAYFQWIKKYKT